MTGTQVERSASRAAGTHENQPRQGEVYYTPRVDLVETEEDLFLFADLPGVRPEDVSLEREGKSLVLHAPCRPRSYGSKTLHAEYGVGNYYRAFSIVEEVEADKIEASLENGVLTVRVPKAQSVRPQRIAVKGA